MSDTERVVIDRNGDFEITATSYDDNGYSESTVYIDLEEMEQFIVIARQRRLERAATIADGHHVI
jgi:hypothetical protein